MILRFAVSNFRSFRKKAELITLAAKSRELAGNTALVKPNLRVVKSAVIYGANAAGKSNFMRAIWSLYRLVNDSAAFPVGEMIPQYEPFAFDAATNKAPTEFEIDFIAPDGFQYQYVVHFTKKEVHYESLHCYYTSQRSKLFVRENSKAIDFGDYYRGEQKAVVRSLSENQLLLSKSALFNIESLIVPWRFFRDQLAVLPPSADERWMRAETAKFLYSHPNDQLRQSLRTLIQIFDTGVEDFRIVESKEDQIPFPDWADSRLRKEVLERLKYDFKVKHRTNESSVEESQTWLDSEDQSSGTKNLFAIGGLVLATLFSGGVLVLDEFEKNLHPKVSRYLVGMFHDERFNPKNAQLIFATHDATLLDGDLLRRDQIWFAEKDEFGDSTLYSMSDFQGIRKDIPFDKWYLADKFGATPIINDLDLILEFENHEN